MLILYHTMRHCIRKKLQHSLPGLSHGAWSLQSLFAASAPWKIFGPLKLVPLGLSFDKVLMVYNYNDHKIEVILITDYLIPFPSYPMIILPLNLSLTLFLMFAPSTQGRASPAQNLRIILKGHLVELRVTLPGLKGSQNSLINPEHRNL